MFGRNSKIGNKIELVSLHIPKTAGTSTRNMLKDHYGEENAIRFDINIVTKRIKIENKVFTKSKLPRNIKVIHGHFYYRDLLSLLELRDDVKYITWLRDPVQRVISNYYYLQKRLREELDEESKGLNILSKMQKTLIEYARSEISINRISKFLEGADLEKFNFVGIMEYYNEDTLALSKYLGLDNPEIYTHNITGSKNVVDNDIMQEITQLNSLDIEIYNQALEIRRKRIRG